MRVGPRARGAPASSTLNPSNATAPTTIPKRNNVPVGPVTIADGSARAQIRRLPDIHRQRQPVDPVALAADRHLAFAPINIADLEISNLGAT